MTQLDGRASQLGVWCLAAASFLSGCFRDSTPATENQPNAVVRRFDQSLPEAIATDAGPAFHPSALTPEQRVHSVPPGPDAQATLQERFVDAAPGDVIQLEEGIYRLTHQLDLAADSITIRGRGSGKTVLSFK